LGLRCPEAEVEEMPEGKDGAEFCPNVLWNWRPAAY
jgi:hypothetical protein